MNPQQKRQILLAAAIAVFALSAGCCYDVHRLGLSWACGICAALLLCTAPFFVDP